MLLLETASAADFAPYIGTEFALGGADGEIPLTLTEATLRGCDNQSGRPFALLFTGPARPPLPQSTYTLTHREMGCLDIFLVPISDDGRQRVYEAVFA